jgi:hypothetical protein
VLITAELISFAGTVDTELDVSLVCAVGTWDMVTAKEERKVFAGVNETVEYIAMEEETTAMVVNVVPELEVVKG